MLRHSACYKSTYYYYYYYFIFFIFFYFLFFFILYYYYYYFMPCGPLGSICVKIWSFIVKLSFSYERMNGWKGRCTRSSAVAKRPHDASCLSVVSFVASIVQYFKRSFFIISYFSFGFTIAYNSILFCCLRRNVRPCCHTYNLSWLCIEREEPRRRWLYSAWHLVVEYPQYTTSDPRPSLQQLACCS